MTATAIDKKTGKVTIIYMDSSGWGVASNRLGVYEAETTYGHWVTLSDGLYHVRINSRIQ